MKTRIWVLAVAFACIATAQVNAQEPPKPGPEHEFLKTHEGDWTITMKAGGMESKGTSKYKMDLGGMWLASSLECDLGGMKFSGRGFDTYDAAKKKYVSVWIDSMGTAPLIMEGTYDKEKKTLTMVGDGPGPDGKLTKWRSVSTYPDKDTISFDMFIGDGKEPMFTVTYKRKK